MATSSFRWTWFLHDAVCLKNQTNKPMWSMSHRNRKAMALGCQHSARSPEVLPLQAYIPAIRFKCYVVHKEPSMGSAVSLLY